MRRVAVILVAVVAVAAVLVVVLGGGKKGDDSGYKVRVIFRNAFSIIPGEDVKIAGVKVGKIDSLDLTKDNRAAAVLDITLKGFQDFRRDAECTIRPQSLIGEKFVECTPTQPRAENSDAPPSLRKIADGEGKGQYGPVTNTQQQVDIDLAANTLRLPYRQRLSILLNELGIGLAGRGEDLNAVIRNANPALAQTDKVLGILAKQNRVLAKLATDSDTIMQPLAREKDRVAGFIDNANKVQQATAERSADLERNIQKLPTFLRQLRPTMQQLGNLSDQATPVLTDLGKQAPAINRLIKQTGPFSEAATPSLVTLGEASVPGREALVKSRPIISDLRSFATAAKPLSTNLQALLQSLRDTGGIERLMDYAFFQASAINGFDAYGHYLRAQLVVNLCSTYATSFDISCSAKFNSTSTRSAKASARSALDAPGRDPVLARTDAVLRGMSPEQVLSQDPASTGGTTAVKDDSSAKSSTGSSSSGSSGSSGSGSSGSGASPLQLPGQVLPGATPQTTTPAPSQSSTGPTGASGGTDSDPASGVLDYLLGGNG